jgi:signal transduction histidine kinase
MKRALNVQRIFLMAISFVFVFGLFFEFFYRVWGEASFGERLSSMPWKLFSATLSVAAIVLLWCWLLVKNSNKDQFLHEYSDQDQSMRPFYEMASDLVALMRRRVGPPAMLMIKRIKGLEVGDDGRVLAMKKDPAEIITVLLLNYEKYFRKKIKIPIRKDKAAYGDILKNMKIFEEYFRRREREREKREKSRLKQEKQEAKARKREEKNDIFLDKIKKIN